MASLRLFGQRYVLPERVAMALEHVFEEPVRAVKVIEYSRYARAHLGMTATTRPNLILLAIGGDEFVANPQLLLHEYFHVLRQWGTGQMTRWRYLLECSVNVISLGPASRARNISCRYRDEWAAGARKSGDLPMIGIMRHIVVAETDGEARRIADEAYRPWREAMEFMWQRSRTVFPPAEIYPQRFEELAAIGHGIAGSPTTVLTYLEELAYETGVNYVACQMIFGTMPFEAAATSVRLLAREVIPTLQRHP